MFVVVEETLSVGFKLILNLEQQTVEVANQLSVQRSLAIDWINSLNPSRAITVPAVAYCFSE